ncbi:MAG: methionine ABC transporter permease [Pseudomonadota bacterium]
MSHEIIIACVQTFYMVFMSVLVSSIIGIPLGIWLETSKPGNVLENAYCHRILDIIINIGRSIPFIILLIAIIPFTRLIVGTSIGTTATIVPLTVGAIPFVARLTETSLMEVPKGLIETGLAMGATSGQIITRFLLPEAWPGIISGITITAIALVNYSAMAGAVGGGGLGDVAIRYGYQRFQTGVMVITIVILVIFVQLIQFTGDFFTKKLNRGEKLK